MQTVDEFYGCDGRLCHCGKPAVCIGSAGGYRHPHHLEWLVPVAACALHAMTAPNEAGDQAFHECLRAFKRLNKN